jgi:hypothetical protein
MGMRSRREQHTRRVLQGAHHIEVTTPETIEWGDEAEDKVKADMQKCWEDPDAEKATELEKSEEITLEGILEDLDEEMGWTPVIQKPPEAPVVAQKRHRAIVPAVGAAALIAASVAIDGFLFAATFAAVALLITSGIFISVWGTNEFVDLINYGKSAFTEDDDEAG